MTDIYKEDEGFLPRTHSPDIPSKTNKSPKTDIPLPELYKWAKNYIFRYRNQPTQAGSTSIGGTEYELILLAEAIVADYEKGWTEL